MSHLNGNGRAQAFPEPLRSVHFLGICGSGMKPLAQALLAHGLSVSGSDPDECKAAALREVGATVYTRHSPANVGTPDAVVYSSAIAPDNPELVAAAAAHIPVFHRSELLAWFLGRYESAVVAGTHGKTTTSAMLALLTERAGLDPWAFIGGHVPQFGGNFRQGGTRLAVAEADESDGSFLRLPRHHAIVTNVEPEHLNYWGSEAAMERGYDQFVDGVPAQGSLVVCLDDPGAHRLLERRPRAHTGYGVEAPEAEFRATEVRLAGLEASFGLVRRGETLGRVGLGVPGMQNVMNALGAFAMADRLGADVAELLGALADFQGVDRRFTRRTATDGYLVIDDYAHHPTEIRATVSAARLLAEERGGRLIAVFQPHRYTRTAACFAAFGPALAQADMVLLTEIHAAGEPPIEGITGEQLAIEIRRAHHSAVPFLSTLESVRNFLTGAAKEDDTVLLLGAGSITKLAALLSVAAEEPVPVDGGSVR